MSDYPNLEALNRGLNVHNSGLCQEVGEALAEIRRLRKLIISIDNTFGIVRRTKRIVSETELEERADEIRELIERWENEEKEIEIKIPDPKVLGTIERLYKLVTEARDIFKALDNLFIFAPTAGIHARIAKWRIDERRKDE